MPRSPIRSTRVAAVCAPAAALVAGVAVLAPGSGAATPMTRLVGSVGPGFTISLTQGGKPVKLLRAGRYTITVTDRAAIHNFVLKQESGGTFEKQITGVPFTGTKTVTLQLRKGSYKYYCAVHSSSMFGTFKVS